jgi:uncharacterized membrane protein YeaQ/YmgE (transglycosylase-associated protein family)
MEFLLTLAGGFCIGEIARHALPSEPPMSRLATALLGIGGALAGTLAGEVLGLHMVGEPLGWVGAVFGAVLLLVLYRAIRLSAHEMSLQARPLASRRTRRGNHAKGKPWSTI